MYRVLLVEDEDIIRKGLMFLANWPSINCEVVGEANDGQDGADKIMLLKPDIVITDVKMPIKSGIEMLSETIPNNSFETIILSGYSEFEYAQKAMSLGVTEYLLKPLDYEELYVSLKRLIARLKENNQLENYRKQSEENKILDSKLMDSTVGSNKHVIDILEFIREHYSEHITLAQLSDTFKISGTYVNLKLKAEIGYTFNDYLNRYRILQAIALLKQGELKVYEISEEVGFRDYKYFIKVFKKYTGYSPAKFLLLI